MRTTLSSFLVFSAIAVSGCVLGDETDSDEPLLIDEDLLTDTFDECVDAIPDCLSDENVLTEIDSRVEAGEWQWPESEDDALDAARSRVVVTTGCTKYPRHAMNGRCWSANISRVGTPWKIYNCGGGKHKYRGICYFK